MGGPFSGRWHGHSKATTVEECRSLDANRWAREEILKPGVHLWGTWAWWRDAARTEQTASLTYEVDTLDPTWPRLWLRYSITRTGESLDYAVDLQNTSAGFGGVRWWFTCPLVVNGWACQRRVGKIYLPPGGRYFGCRHCYRLTYRSAQEHDKRVDLLRNNPEALAALLDNLRGASPGQLILALKAFG